MATEKDSLEDIYREKLLNHRSDLQLKFSQLQERGVLISTIKTMHLQELAIMRDSIFSLVQNEEYEYPADPFMEAMLNEFNRLLLLKEDNPISKLFEQRKNIEEKTKRIRFWSENEFINQADEFILDFIAKFQIYRGVAEAWDKENAFKAWQQSNKDECPEVIYDALLPEFIKIEKQIFLLGYLSHSGKWIDEKKYLLGLINVLLNKGYLKKQEGKNVLKHIHYRKFFERRYHIEMAKESQPGLRKKIGQEYMRPFSFILDKS